MVLADLHLSGPLTPSERDSCLERLLRSMVGSLIYNQGGSAKSSFGSRTGGSQPGELHLSTGTVLVFSSVPRRFPTVTPLDSLKESGVVCL